MSIQQFIDVMMNIIRPKWENSNPKVRLAAIQHTENQTVLVNVGMNDSNPDIRMAAAKKIKDEDVLTKMACSHADDVLWFAFNNMKKKENIITLIKKYNWSYDHKHDWIPKKMIRLTDDHQLLKEIAFNAKNSNDQQAAIEKIKDENLLIDVISSNISYISWLFIKYGKLSQESLFKIVRNLKIDETNRVIAVERMSEPNQQILIEVAETDPSDFVRIAAIDRITAKDVLERITKGNGSAEVRLSASNKLGDKEIVKAIQGSIIASLDEIQGTDKFPNLWRDQHTTHLLSIIKSNGGTSNGCPYVLLGVCMFRVSTSNYTSFGPEECSWKERPYRSCSVYCLAPK